MHRDQKPREWKAFPPLTFWAKCFPQGFTVAVPSCLPWPCTGCWSSKQSMWWTPSSEQPYFTQPSARGCYTAVPISVLLFLPLISSPFCGPFSKAHFQSLMPPSPSFFLTPLSRATGDGESVGEGLYFSSLPACLLPGSKKEMIGSLSSCCHHMLRRKECFGYFIHTAVGEERCWGDQSIFFPPPDLNEVEHKGPKSYRDYRTSHCQSSQLILLPQLLPSIMTLYSSLLWLTWASKLQVLVCRDSRGRPY